MPHRSLCPCPQSRLVTDTPQASLPPPSVPSSPCCQQSCGVKCSPVPEACFVQTPWGRLRPLGSLRTG